MWESIYLLNFFSLLYHSCFFLYAPRVIFHKWYIFFLLITSVSIPRFLNTTKIVFLYLKSSERIFDVSVCHESKLRYKFKQTMSMKVCFPTRHEKRKMSISKTYYCLSFFLFVWFVMLLFLNDTAQLFLI